MDYMSDFFKIIFNICKKVLPLRATFNKIEKSKIGRRES